ncbi:hypothetical protein XELAEV_18004285mg [Xenopus laevis]|uniref:Uncharacterized protein n=1 Tax=Xenopus laevis TaxID=8355 RepID=A0A974GYY4_XENLA|nr:hypothetical protein XELAEV_18004285mg [Xenopus laevis]
MFVILFIIDSPPLFPRRTSQQCKIDFSCLCQCVFHPWAQTPPLVSIAVTSVLQEFPVSEVSAFSLSPETRIFFSVKAKFAGLGGDLFFIFSCL